MKLIFELSLLLAFFIVFKWFGIYPAIATAMVLYSGQILYQLGTHQKVDKLQWVTLGSVLILGGASLLFRNELFFKWKPSIVYFLFACAILITPLFTRAPTLQKILGHQLKLPLAVWRKLDYAWAGFFTLVSGLNLVIAYRFGTETWVYFKLFGTLALMLLFMVGQALWLAPYLKNQEGS